MENRSAREAVYVVSAMKCVEMGGTCVHEMRERNPYRNLVGNWCKGFNLMACNSVCLERLRNYEL